MEQYSLAIIENTKGEVFLVRKSWSAPTADYKFSFPGGMVEKGETPLQAVCREMREETGITIKESECSHILTVDSDGDNGKIKKFYYKVHSENFNEEDVILNYENDKYQFISKEDYDADDLIPNLDIVLDFLCKNERFDYNSQTIKVGGILEKSFLDLLQPNPYQSVFEKGLDTSKLVLKEITDKMGRTMKKWVRASKPEGKTKKPKAEEKIKEKKPKAEGDEGKEPKKETHSGIDYHSVYNDAEKLANHAKEATPEQLATFIEKEKTNPNATNLVKLAENELKSRGIEKPSAQDKSPYGEKEKKAEEKKASKEPEAKSEKETKPETESSKEPEKKEKESEHSVHGQEHLDLADLADEPKDVVNYLPFVEKDKNLSDEEKERVKSKMYEHIGKLTHQSATDASKKEETKKEEPKKEEPKKEEPKKEAPKKEPESKEKEVEEKTFESKEKAEEKPKVDYSQMDDKEKFKKIDGAKQYEDGVYNMETGEGWVGDESLGEKVAEESEKIDNNIRSDISNLIDKDTRVGALTMQTGPGGLGKTFTAIKELKDNGHEEIKIGDKSKRGDKSKKGYVHVKGGMTPTSLFETMHDYPHATFVIDDAEKIFNNADALEYIKAATDTGGQTVTRGVAGSAADKADIQRERFTDQMENLKEDHQEHKDEYNRLVEERDPGNDRKIKAVKKKIRESNTKLRDKQRSIDALGDIRAKQFDFKGKVMMISNGFPLGNKELKKRMYDPLMSRTSSGQITDLAMSKEAKLHKLSTLIPHFDGGDHPDGGRIEPKNFGERKEVYDFVKKMVQDDRINDVSTRILSGVFGQKRQHEKAGKNWKMEVASQYKKANFELEKSMASDINIYNHLENLIFGL